MQRKAFHYNIVAREWRECRDEKTNAEDIEKIPVHFVVHSSDGHADDHKDMIWCPSHKTYEKVISHEEFSLVTAAGCKFEGLFGCVNSTVDESTPAQDILLRSRLLYNEGSGLVTIFSDAATIKFRSIKDCRHKKMTCIPHPILYKVESVAVMLKGRKMLPQNRISDIPVSSARAALIFLQEEAKRICGHAIRLPNSIHGNIFPSGESILSAFLYNPSDMNIWLLRNYFRSGQDFFGSSFDEDFLNICNAFHLEPDEYLKNLYDCNPLALPILSVLHLLGIRKRELTEPFLKSRTFLGDSVADGLKNVIGYSPIGRIKTGFPVNFFDNEENIRNFLEHRATRNDTWNPLLFYCQYRLRYEEEGALAHHLRDMNTNWEPGIWDRLRLFFHNFPDLPENVRDRVLKEGLTLDVHNEMMRICKQKKLASPEFTYSDKERRYECRIDGYDFRLIRSSESYWSVMQELGFYNTNRTALPDNGIVRMTICKEDKPVAYFELHGIALLMKKSDGSFYNNCLRDADIRIAFLHWLKWTGLWEGYGPYYEEDYEILQEDVTAQGYWNELVHN